MNMKVLGLVAAVFPLLMQFFTFLQMSRKDKNNLTEKLAEELHRDQPKAYVIESLVSKIHRTRSLCYTKLRVILQSDHAFEMLKILSQGRRNVNIIGFDNGKFQYENYYAIRAYRRFIRVFLILVAGGSYYLGVRCFFSLMDFYFNSPAKYFSEPFKDETYLKILIMSLQITIYLLIYFISAMHGLSIWLARWRINALNSLLNGNFERNIIYKFFSRLSDGESEK